MFLISELPQAPRAESTTGLEEQQDVDSLSTGCRFIIHPQWRTPRLVSHCSHPAHVERLGTFEGLVYLKAHLTLPGIIPLRDFSGPGNTSHMLIDTLGQGVASQGFQFWYFHELESEPFIQFCVYAAFQGPLGYK